MAPLTAATLGLQAIGTGISAAGTIAGGNYARQAGLMQQQADDFQAAQLEQNAGQEVAASQRQMLDKQLQTRMALSTLTARMAASGASATAPGAVATASQLAGRGEYQALTDLWQGQNRAAGLINQAQGVRYSGQLAAIGGQEQQDASALSAFGTIAGGAGSMLKTYRGFS